MVNNNPFSGVVKPYGAVRSESPVRDTLMTMRATTAAAAADTRSSRHIKELLSSRGTMSKVGSYDKVEKMKAEVRANHTVYRSPRWGSVQRTEPFDRRALPVRRFTGFYFGESFGECFGKRRGKTKGRTRGW